MTTSERAPSAGRPRKGPSRGARSPGRPRGTPGPGPTAAPGKPPSPRASSRRAKRPVVAPGKPDTQSAQAGAPGELKIKRPPVWNAAWAWLLADTSRSERKTERERAKQRLSADDEARRKAYVRSQMAKATHGLLGAANSDRRQAGQAQGTGAAASEGPTVAPTERAQNKKVDETKPTPSRVALFWHKVLGERTATDDDGDRVIIPPAKTDFRWSLHQFFRSNKRIMSFTRSALVLTILIFAAWSSTLSVTGFDLIEVLDPVDPEDPRTAFRIPFFIIESGSMMHHDAPYGRLGTVDPGDLVIIKKLDPKDPIQTFYGSGDREVAGAKGDVIMYLPLTDGVDDSLANPIIHRAMAYLHREEIRIPNPNTGANQPATLPSPRFTVEEFGIYDARSVTIPELGLRNYQPISSGYLTRGDNIRSNNWADQALGVTSYPVPEDRILGRMAVEVPYIGLAKIAIAGQAPGLISADDQWCSFLAGQAACDTWVPFFILVIVLVGGPLIITLIVFGRRFYIRQMDRHILRKQQEAELARRAEAKGGADTTGDGTRLRPFDAADLLSGKVRVAGVVAGSGPQSWDSLVQPGRVIWSDENESPESVQGHGSR